MFEITGVRHMYPEPAGFFIDRKKGHSRYTFLHFHNSVRIRMGGEEIRTLPHAVILYAPQVPQYFYSEEPLLHDWFHFSGEWDSLPLTRFCAGEIFYPSCHEEITRMVAQLETEFFLGENDSFLLSDCKLKELFITLDRDLGEKGAYSVGNETLQKFRFLRGEMFATLHRQHSVTSLSERAGLSQSRFFALYRKIYGTSPVSDLIVARIRSAKNKLAYTEATVDAIAASLAYENTSHFIRQFKSRTGMTPCEYRKAMEKEKSKR